MADFKNVFLRKVFVMKEECLICKAPLEYLNEDTLNADKSKPLSHAELIKMYLENRYPEE